MADTPTRPDPNILWWELDAELRCECEEGTDISDCTLPSRVQCEHCGNVYRLSLKVGRWDGDA